MAHALANDISHISIHALLAESDAAAEYGVPIIDGFLSTLSLRRATGAALADKTRSEISIHALLAESDPGVARVVVEGEVISIHALLAESDAEKPALR